MHVTFPANFIFLYLMNLIQYLVRSAYYESPQYGVLHQLPITFVSFALVQIFPLTILFSDKKNP
jgi:hypothetical protein